MDWRPLLDSLIPSLECCRPEYRHWRNNLMKNFRHLAGVTTLRLDPEACVGCGQCTQVCPHGVFELNSRKAHIIDHDGCMECGACATNCPVDAIQVSPGVGCAAYIIKSWTKGKAAAACC
jgi:NAD-dependent dihydropyrimidine dehydrogenase PreA subunit